MRGVRAWPVALCALATALAGSSAAAAPPPVADTVVRNAKIYTVDARRRTVQAIAIKDGKIIYAGDEKGLKPFIGSRTAIKDAKGKLMLPGLIDAHIHPIGIVDFGGCNLQAKPYTLAQIATIVGGCVKDAKLKPGEWLGVSQWEYAAGNQTDDRFKTLRDALDAASPTNPIVMTGWDGHHGAYNSAALKLARNAQGATVGYSRETLEKDFAQFKALVGVDSHGEPSGDIQDEGKSPIDSSSVSRMNFEKLLAAPNRLSERLNSVGITAIQDAAASMGDGVFGKDSIYRIYDELLERGQMTFRVNMAQFWLPDAFKKPDGDIDWDALLAKVDAVRRKYARSPLTTADVVKVFADGDMEANPNNTPPTFGASPRPVPYLQPIFEKDALGFLSVKDYVDINAPVCVHVRSKPEDYGSPQEVANFIKRYGYHPGQCAISYGTTSFAPWVFAEYVKRAHLAGYTVHIHTISDAAVDMAITAIEEARKADGNSSRPDTLAHIQCATPAAVQRMGRDKLYGVFTYSWHYAEPHGYDMSTIPFFDKVHGNSYEALHNPDGYFERCTYPTKTAKTAGVILAAGSDAPVLTSDPQPFVNMEIGVTRARRGLQPLSPWQRLTIEDLVEAYTINGARNLRRDADIGSLEVGKSADFIIVDRDILQLGDSGHADRIGDTRVMETWFMGKPVYTASAAN